MPDKAVNLWTDEEALVHFEERLKLFENERQILIEGARDGDEAPLWANNRGAESAVARLAELIVDYQRIVRLVSVDIRSKQQGA